MKTKPQNNDLGGRAPLKSMFFLLLISLFFQGCTAVTEYRFSGNQLKKKALVPMEEYRVCVLGFDPDNKHFYTLVLRVENGKKVLVFEKRDAKGNVVSSTNLPFFPLWFSESIRSSLSGEKLVYTFSDPIKSSDWVQMKSTGGWITKTLHHEYVSIYDLNKKKVLTTWSTKDEKQKKIAGYKLTNLSVEYPVFYTKDKVAFVLKSYYSSLATREEIQKMDPRDYAIIPMMIISKSESGERQMIFKQDESIFSYHLTGIPAKEMLFFVAEIDENPPSIWSFKNGDKKAKLFFTIDRLERVVDMKASPDGKRLALLCKRTRTDSEDQIVYVFDIQTKKQIQRFFLKESTAPCFRLFFLGNDKIILNSGAENRDRYYVDIYNAKTGAFILRKKINRHLNATSSDGKRFLVEP